MGKNTIKKNFDILVFNLKKYCLNKFEPIEPGKEKIYFSKKYNAYIVELKCIEYLIYSGKYFDKLKLLYDEYKNVNERKSAIEEWEFFCSAFKQQNPYRAIKLRSKFRLFIYLLEDNFCFDIEENEIRINLIKIKMPDKIIGDHNGETALAFENIIKKQVENYLKAKPNIDVITSL